MSADISLFLHTLNVQVAEHWVASCERIDCLNADTTFIMFEGGVVNSCRKNHLTAKTRVWILYHNGVIITHKVCHTYGMTHTMVLILYLWEVSYPLKDEDHTSAMVEIQQCGLRSRLTSCFLKVASSSVGSLWLSAEAKKSSTSTRCLGWNHFLVRSGTYAD